MKHSGKALKCGRKLTFLLDTASSMMIFVDWKTYHTFFMDGTVYPMKHCKPSNWAATIYNERWRSEADSQQTQWHSPEYGHYSI